MNGFVIVVLLVILLAGIWLWVRWKGPVHDEDWYES